MKSLAINSGLTEQEGPKKNLFKLEDLIKTYSDGIIPYPKLIKTKNWIDKRAVIIKRDKETCQNCKVKGFDSYSDDVLEAEYFKGNYHVLKNDSKIHKNNIIRIPEVWSKKKSLHVHHKLYYFDPIIKKHVYPWLYKDEELVTLCSKCHEEEHKNNPPLTLHKDSLKNIILTACERCNGIGILYEFLHVQNGVCFKCWGAKYQELQINEKFIKSQEKKLKARKVFEKEWDDKFGVKGTYENEDLVLIDPFADHLSINEESKNMYCKKRIIGFSKTDAFNDVFKKEYTFYFLDKEIKDRLAITFNKDDIPFLERYCKYRMKGYNQYFSLKQFSDPELPNTPATNKTGSNEKSSLNISQIITLGLALYMIVGLTVGIGRALINDFFGTIQLGLLFFVPFGIFMFFYNRH